jgi:uncharacterized protein YndB with AHSA1/START domain
MEGQPFDNRKNNVMAKSEFVYVIYIRTTPKELWQALADPAFTRQYWFATWQECAWKPGAAWQIKWSDGQVMDSGQILKIKAPRRLVLKWRHEHMPALRAEGYSRLTYELKKQGQSVRFTVHHQMPKPRSKFIDAVSEGWPRILSSLKSLLETGKPL